MDLNHIKYQYHSVTYSSETTSSTLNNVHSVQDPLVWTPNTGTTSEWIKINLYYLTDVSDINFKYSGECESFKIEYSLDNFNWEVLSDTWVPESKTLNIDYSSRMKKMVFIRLTVNTPVDFVLDDLDIYSDVNWTNTDIISHNYLRAYGIDFRNNYPMFPSFIMDAFKMMENYNNIDKTLFDESIYATTEVSCTQAGSVGQLSISNLIVDSTLQYIWDYDEVNTVYEEGTDGAADILVDATSLTTDIDLSEYSIDELATKYLIITTGMNIGSYQILTNTNNATGNTITLSSAIAYTLSDMNFKIQDISESQLLDNPNIITTANPVVNPVDHEYVTAGIYHPRLLIIGLGYMLEFVTSITII